MSALICGVDEAGRGPLAGPVVAAAVILDATNHIDGLRDSKKLSAAQRTRLAAEIRSRALAWHVASATVQEIDEINILQASLLAMRRAVEGLTMRPVLALIDGNQLPHLHIAARAIVGGDASEPCISAASILAKTHRDALMAQLDTEHPGYGFAKHAGYPTPAHLAALKQLGPSAVHRQTFGPVRACLLSS